jgi:hypothetical protein
MGWTRDLAIGWPAVGTRVRYPIHKGKGGTKLWLTGEVVSDYRANSYRVAIWRDGVNTRSVVFRNRTMVERIDGGS